MRRYTVPMAATPTYASQVVATPRPLLDRDCGALTLDDWYTLPDSPDRYELLHGMLIMAPPPGGAHQSATSLLASALLRAGLATGGFAWSAPFGVGLSASIGFEPDISYLAAEHMSRLKERGIEGPPDIVVEALSPSTRRYDLTIKLPLYLEYGVREVWIVDPVAKTVEVHANGRELRRVRFGERIPSEVVDVGSADLERLPTAGG